MHSSVRRRTLISVACAVLCIGAAAASIAAIQAPSSDPAALTQELNRINQERDRLQQRLRGVTAQQRQVTRQLTRIDVQLDQTETRLEQVARNIRSVRADVETAAGECRQAEDRLNLHREDVAARLVAIYQSGEVHPAEVLFQSISFTDFANRVYLLNQVARQDVQILGEFEGAEAEAEARRAALADQEQRLTQLQQQIVTERRRAEAQRQAAEQRKVNLVRDRAAWERALAELEEDSRGIEAMLQRLNRTPDSADTTGWQGSLDWPLRGRITSGYGYRTHPIFRVRRMHTGIDIAAPTGTPIRAPAGGTVVHASRWGGYGNCVIIDHGSNMATLYGHCSRFAVSEGQHVNRGDTIAYVGSTGLSTGPHLHFEVRRDGRPVDPTQYLP